MKNKLISEEQEQIIADNMTKNDIDQQIDDVAEMQKQSYPVSSEFERIYDSESPNDNYLRRLEEIQKQAREELNKSRQKADIEKAAADIMSGLSYGPGYGRRSEDFYDSATEKRGIEDYERTLKEFEALKPASMGKGSAGQFFRSARRDLTNPNVIKEIAINPYTKEEVELGEKVFNPFQEHLIETSEQRANARKIDQDIRARALGFRMDEANELSDQQVAEITSLDNIGSGLDRLESTATNMTKYLGPYSSKLENFKQMVPGMERDPKFVAFQSDIGSAIADYIKSVSGAAVSDQERAFLLQNRPTIDDKPNEFLAKIKTAREIMNKRKNITLKNLEKYKGKKLPKKEENNLQTRETKTVERRTKDGKIAIFDADTKKFIKYKD